MSDNLKSKVVKGTFWAFLERISGQIITFGVGIILARLLSPTDYGTVALLGIFIGDRSCHGKGYGFQALEALKRKGKRRVSFSGDYDRCGGRESFGRAHLRKVWRCSLS